MSDVSELLMVAFLLRATGETEPRATGAIRSWHKKGGFTHGHSFVMGDLSESLTVALLLRGKRAIGSWSLFLKSEVSESFTVAQ